MHARRIRPASGPLDRRRLAAAGLSALIPGLGQALNRRLRLAVLFLVPSLIVLVVGASIVTSQSPARLAAWVVAPSVLGTVLTLNLVLLAWRLVAVGQAFLDPRWAGPTGRMGIIGVVLLAILVAIPHLVVYRSGNALAATFARIFDGSSLAGSGPGGSANQIAGPGPDERINVLLIGVDKLRYRPATLTDTMIVASLDPVGETVSLVSVPRDLVNVPLGNGDRFEPKLNSLMAYADDHPEILPGGGIATLEAAIGSLLQIRIHYYARINFGGFIEMVDAVGGVDVDVVQGFDDPTYDGYNLAGRGWSVVPGQHHFDGGNALAYARSRKAKGESDFARADRQQQIILALRDAVSRDGSLLFQLPDLLDAVGETVRTDLPIERLPQLAAIVEEIEDASVIRTVIRHPLVRSRETRFGSSLVPDLTAIATVSAGLFPAPGTPPLPWPTPRPSDAAGPASSP